MGREWTAQHGNTQDSVLPKPYPANDVSRSENEALCNAYVRIVRTVAISYGNSENAKRKDSEDTEFGKGGYKLPIRQIESVAHLNASHQAQQNIWIQCTDKSVNSKSNKDLIILGGTT